MKQSKKYSALYQFLSPLLEAGADDETLANARKEYSKAYKAKWQREHRKTNKRYTLSFNKVDQRTIEIAATKHHRSPAMFIKAASLAYSIKQFLSLDESAVNTIRELLSMNYCLLQQITEDRDIQNDNLLSMIESLEKKILDTLTNPKEIR